MRKIYSNFFEALLNFFLFLPHFFSISSLIKTLLSPWKNLVAKKTEIGFTFKEWLNRISFNLISRVIGFFTRFSIMLFFFVTYSFYVLIIPFIIILFTVFSPFIYFFSTLKKTEDERKNELKDNFVSNHTLKKENLPLVEQWFEETYTKLYQNKWWKLENLLSIPPLARDWAVGYTPLLDQYCQELTSASYLLKIKFITGREKELKEIEQVLSKSEEANVLLVGEEGIGKQTIVDSFAKKIYEGKSNVLLNYKRILKVNLETILTKYTDQKQREHFLEELLKEADSARNVILMIEDLEKYVSHGAGNIDLTTPIERFAKRSTLQIIATSTPFMFEKYIFRNAKINQLFTKVDVFEVSKRDALRILLHLALYFEKRYGLTIPYETVVNTVEKSEFYITHIPFPEKTIELLDTACAFYFQKGKKILTPADVDQVLSTITHAPVTLERETKDVLIDLEKSLSSRIIAQPQAIQQLAASLRRSYVLLGKRKKPLASFLFLGPTGVGKTETAKVLADIFFHDEKKLIRFDMSIYQSKDDIPNLIGSLESNNPGLLTQAIRDNPYGVLLLDEIEKANSDLLNIFLTILDEGYFVDGFGKRVDCKNLMIIATSNAGSDLIFKSLTQQTNAGIDLSQNLINFLIEKGQFSPEFINRFDGVVVFNPLDEQALFQIARKIIEKLKTSYQDSHKIQLVVSDQTLQNLLSKGVHKEFGARDLERTVLQEIQDKINKEILAGTLKEGSILTL